MHGRLRGRAQGWPDARPVIELIWQHHDSTNDRNHLHRRRGAEGGFTARALDFSIFTEADDAVGVGENVRDAIRCHVGEGERPRLMRLHFVRQEILAV